MGRCTTSQAVAALGFLEHAAADVLQIPKTWRRGGVGAYHRLRQEPLRQLDHMNRALCPQDIAENGESSTGSKQALDASSKSEGNAMLWENVCDDPTQSSDRFPFAAHYRYKVSSQERKLRKAQARRFSLNELSAKTIRMAWGNSQEATALLTALNYFAREDAGFIMREVGMCGAGLDLNQTTDYSSLLIGATPDAILCHSDGRIEALEVKNHCPFMTPWAKKGKKGSPNRFIVSDFPFDDKVRVFSHYIPQLQMEMLCLGPDCKSAVMVRQTALNGARLLRMQRDDHWIEEMLHFLHRFQNEFVAKAQRPPANFFWLDSDKEEAARYRRFVNTTLEMRKNVELVEHIPNEHIQRVPEEAPLFLD
jgi:hypothetical protein